MNVIGLHGFAGSGKGEVAKILSEILPGRVKLLGFADKVKIYAAKQLGYRGSDSDLIRFMDEFKERGRVDSFASLNEVKRAMFPTSSMGLTGREYLQNVGNEAREIFGEGFWVDQVLPYGHFGISDDIPAYEGFDWLVIVDLRYTNEAYRVQWYRGEVWNIMRPGIVAGRHISEFGIPAYLIDKTVYNDGSLADLRKQVESFV